MSHEISSVSGRSEVFVAGAPAWHGLGVNVADAQSSADAIRLAGLDWTVDQYPVVAVAPDGSTIKTKSVANVRTDCGVALGVVGESYHVFQNAECFDFMDAIVGEGLAQYESAGALKDGRRVWMLARAPQSLGVGDDRSEPYFLLVNSHDGTKALQCLPTTVRVVCQNTLSYALRLGRQHSKNGISIRHRPNLAERVADAKTALGVVSARLANVQVEMDALAGRRLSVAESNAYFEQFYPTKSADVIDVPAVASSRQQTGLLDAMLGAADNATGAMAELIRADRDRKAETADRKANRNRAIMADILATYDREARQFPQQAHTAWGAFNAVSEYVDHRMPTRGRNASERADNKLNARLLGSGAELKQRAYAAALALCN